MYEVYLGRVLLPIPPQKISVKCDGSNKTATLINEGEINILKSPKLKTIEFSATLPQSNYPSAKTYGSFRSASYYINALERMRKRKRPFQFLITRSLPNGRTLFSTNIKVCLESWSYADDVREGFDIVLDIKLKEYKAYGTKVVYIAPETPEVAKVEEERPAETSPEPQQTQSYTVQKGDCLWKIAKQFYGNGADYNKIFNANTNQISNPNLIYEGQTLVIPV